MNLQNDLRLTQFLTEFHKSDQMMIMNADEAGPELNYLESMIKKDCNECDLSESKIEECRIRCNKRIITWMQKSYANITLDMRRKSE